MMHDNQNEWNAMLVVLLYNFFLPPTATTNVIKNISTFLCHIFSFSIKKRELVLGYYS